MRKKKRSVHRKKFFLWRKKFFFSKEFEHIRNRPQSKCLQRLNPCTTTPLFIFFLKFSKIWKNYLNKSIDLVCIKNFSEDTIYSKNINFQKRGKINLLSTSKNKSNLLIGEGFTNKLTSNTFLIKTINPKVNINN